MPIKIPDNLPAYKTLTSENIFVMREDRAQHQDIRPLEIGILNLMPKKIETETQILRLLGNSPLQVNITLVKTESYKSKNVSSDHLFNFYKVFSEIKDRKFDGFIITGAPVEKMEFEDVGYWNELVEIMQWTTTNVFSTFHICWGAQAGLYFHYGINKYSLNEKLSGIYKHKVNKKKSRLLRGFDYIFNVPHSRHTANKIDDIKNCKYLDLLSYSEKAGLYICADKTHKRIFVTGHSEYDDLTLKNEYERDLKEGLSPDIPENYFENDDPNKEVNISWRAHANMLYVNWLNYAVYQETPFDLSNLNN